MRAVFIYWVTAESSLLIYALIDLLAENPKAEPGLYQPTAHSGESSLETRPARTSIDPLGSVPWHGFCTTTPGQP